MTQYTHIRNATGKLTIKNTTFLIDPFLAPKDTYPGFEGTFNYQQRMPMVDLPVSMDNLLSNVTAVVVTHTHISIIGMTRQLNLFQSHFLFLCKIQRTKNLLSPKALMMYASFLKVLSLMVSH